MQRIWLPLVVIAALAVATASAAADSVPKIDKQKLSDYIRYAEGFSSSVAIALDDPVPSSTPGFYRLVAHLSNGQQKLDRVYYVSPSGQEIVTGILWNVHESPFTDTLARLPAQGPAFGPANAKVTIVVFSDFECPYCRSLAKTVRDNLAKKYPNDVRVVFIDFPIESIHKWARAAAEAGQCIYDEKAEAFWPFHDWIFEHQGEINEGNLKSKILDYAKTQSLDETKLGSCFDSHASSARVAAEEKAGQQLQISQTPTLFVNGRMVGGAVPWNTLDAVIQMELNRPKDIPPASDKCCEVSIPQVGKK